MNGLKSCLCEFRLPDERGSCCLDIAEWIVRLPKNALETVLLVFNFTRSIVDGGGTMVNDNVP